MCTRDLYTLRAPLTCIVFDHDLPRQYKNSHLSFGVYMNLLWYAIVCLIYYITVYILCCAHYIIVIIRLEGKTRNIRFIRIKIIIMHILQPR